MKKNIIIAAVIIAALAFGVTSCKKEEKAKCWKVTYSLNVEGENDTLDFYWWFTEADLDAGIANCKEDLELQGATVINVVKEEASKYTTQADCDAQNFAENGGWFD